MPSPHEDWISRLFDESGQDLLRFLVRRLGNAAEAEDLTQEVYLRLLRVEDVDRIRDHRAFALRVAANVAHEWRMLARNRMEHSSEALEEQVSKDNGPAELASQAQETRHLTRALDRLSPVHRAVLLLHKRDGLTFEQIAKFVRCSVPTVRRQLALGLMACREALARAHEERIKR